MVNKKILTVTKASVIALKAYEKNKRKKRKCWVRKFYQERHNLEFYELSYKSLKSNNEDLFFKATRMNKENFQVIFNLMKHRLTKKSIRRPISAECRLFLTLMYLAHGGSRINYSL